MADEYWKDIEGFPGYQVSSEGRIRSFWNNAHNITNEPNIITGVKDKDGYIRVHLHVDTKSKIVSLHRLIAKAFIPNPDNKPQVNHINGIKDDNRVKNLEWCTLSENRQHAYDTGLQNPPGEQPVKIIETGEVFKSISECARQINGHESGIRKCLYGERHTHKGLHFEYVNEMPDVKRQPFLRDYQYAAVKKMHNGCILNGGVGSGKSRSGLYYYFTQQGGSIENNYVSMKNPKDLYIITTARKRDTLEWNEELAPFLLCPTEYLKDDDDYIYDNKIIVDSWNNIQKYTDIKDAFFIFDEQRVVGSGAWVKAFLKICKANEWILLSATPGDTWQDYIPVFIANGFYKNKTEFIREHIVYSRFVKYPKVDRYLNTGRLIRLRNRILVNMDFERSTVSHHEDVWCNYDIRKYKEIGRDRWNPYKDEPIVNASELCYTWRKLVNSDESRQTALLDICADHPKVIIFYNFDYELDILKSLIYINDGDAMDVAEWNGHKHQEIPKSNKWIYLVQYTAGCEGWNCIDTDTIVFFSQNYSYKTLEQARGRIDRMNTPYTDLYYYHLKSKAPIDLAISRAIKNKKNFNEMKFISKGEIK